MSQKTSSKLSLLFYRNTQPYLIDDKTKEVITKPEVRNNKIVDVPQVDKTTWTKNIKVCYLVENPDEDISVPSSLSKDFINLMAKEKADASQSLSYHKDAEYHLDPNSVNPSTVKDQPVIYATYKARSLFVSKLAIQY